MWPVKTLQFSCRVIPFAILRFNVLKFMIPHTFTCHCIYNNYYVHVDAVNVDHVNYEFYVSDSVLYIIHFTHFVAINLKLVKAL